MVKLVLRKSATLIGDGASALKEIRAIGDDMSLDPGMGTWEKRDNGSL